MNTVAKIQERGQITIPTTLRTRAGLSTGDLVELKFQRGKIIITPKGSIDYSPFPNADDEYTPRQRRIIDARLAKAVAEVRKGNVSPAYNTAEEFMAALKADASKLPRKSKRTAVK
jgi:AbrB family looped-hinge helix DNA binding protein